MSITSPDDRISTYNPVVPTTEFPAGFPVFDNDDIIVIHDGVERDDFAVSATYVEGVSTDAKAVFAVGITGKVQVAGARDPHRTNEFGNGPLPVRDFNLALDTVESEIQEARRDLGRALKMPFGEVGQNVPLPEPGKILGWSTGGALNNMEAGAGDVAFGAIGVMVAGASTMQEAQDAIRLGADLTVTVGTGGDFATINAALSWLSVLNPPRYKSNGYSVELKLLSGFVMAEQVVVDKIDLGWITITAVDATVTIQRSALTEPQYNLYYPAFTASRGARLPIIACQFEMDTSGAATMKNGIFIVDGAWGRVEPGCGVRNAGGRGLHVANTSSCVARATDFSGAGECAVRNSNSFVEVRQSNLQNSGIGLKLAGCGTTDAEDANISGCTLGIENYESTLRFGNGIANNCGTGAYIEGAHTEADFASFNACTVRGVEVRLGSRVNLRSASINSCGGIALLVSSATVSAPNLSATNATSHAVFGINGANIDVNTATLTGAGAASYGILAQQGSFINAQAANATGAGAAGYRAQDGSIINARGGATGTVDSSNIPNVLNGNGFVFTGDAPPFTTGATTFAPSVDNAYDIGSAAKRVRISYAREFVVGNGIRIISGSGDPNGVYAAPVGSIFLRTDGGPGTAFNIKESGGTGTSGWVAK